MTPTTDMAAVVDALRVARPLSRHLTRESRTETRSGRCSRCTWRSSSSARTASWCSSGRRRCRASTGFSSCPSHGLLRELPADAAERVLVAVDCAQETRLTDARAARGARSSSTSTTITTTPASGPSNLVAAEASSTAEVLADVFAELGVSLTPAIAEALYAGLVTDTGRFQYANTTPKALRLAAELLEAGADLQRIFQGVYESMQFAKVKLLARALDRATLYERGPGRRLVSPAHATSPRWGRWSRTRRGSSTSSVPSRARSSRR